MQDSGGFPPETSDAGKPLSDSSAVVDDAATSDGNGGAGDGGLTVATLTLLNTAITNVVQGAPVPGYDPLVDGTTFSLATVGTQLSIRANTEPSPTGSVSFQYDGTQHTENALPYTLCGDNGAGTITNCNIAAGAHTLTVTPYTAANLGGTAGAPLTINFTVTP